MRSRRPGPNIGSFPGGSGRSGRSAAGPRQGSWSISELLQGDEGIAGVPPYPPESEFGCDEIVLTPEQVLFRALDVEAPAERTFRWLCQLQVGPYSYDLLDNRGRRSPQELACTYRADTAGADRSRIVVTIAVKSPLRRLVGRSPARCSRPATW